MSNNLTKCQVLDLMKAHDLKFKKSLGQNFLTDQNVLRRIIGMSEIDKHTGVIEIGPGIGVLTQALAEQAAVVVALEIDQRFIPILKTQFALQPHVHIEHADALKVDYKEIISKYMAGLDHNERKLDVIANLPYYVTTPIIMGLLEFELPLRNITVMIQKEVAERIAAQPGGKEYGALSIAAQFYAEPKLLFVVPRTAFTPAPNVDSAVLQLRMRERPAVDVLDKQMFFRVVKAGFAQRRKTLWNNLKQFSDCIPTEKMQAILDDVAIDSKRRGETLTISEYGKLADAIFRALP